VNALAWAAFAAAVVFAVLDWVAVARNDKPLEYFAKPATMVALIVVALALDPTSSGRRGWFVAALLFSLAGDVFLMLPRDLFVAGLAAFLVGHICYVVGFWLDPPGALALVVSLVVVAVLVAPVATRIMGAVRRGEPELFGPVAAYIGVISVMLVSAIASGNATAAVGAALFTASDSMIAWNRFVQSFRAAPVGIMVTYHAAQALLVLSLLS
jgi:uncharacterized membrane protein YhhN